MSNNPFKDLESLRAGADVVEFPQEPTKGRNKAPKKARRFAYVPLHDNWGYLVLSLAGSGAGIVLHALYVQRTTGKGDVPITAEVLRRCGIHRHTRTRTLQRLARAGVATVGFRGKRSPLLTLHLPIE